MEKPPPAYRTDIYKCPSCLEKWTIKMENAWVKLDREWKHRVSPSDWDEVFEHVEILWLRAHHYGSTLNDCYKKAEECMKPYTKLLRWLKMAAAREREARFKRGQDHGADIEPRKKPVPWRPISRKPGRTTTKEEQKENPEGVKGVDMTGSDVSSSKYWAGEMTDEQYETMLKVKYPTCASEKDDKEIELCVVM